MPSEQVVHSNWSTIQAAADRYDVTDKTIRNWIAAGLIEAKRFGPRIIRVNLDSIEALGRPLQYGSGGGAA